MVESWHLCFYKHLLVLIIYSSLRLSSPLDHTGRFNSLTYTGYQSSPGPLRMYTHKSIHIYLLRWKCHLWLTSQLNYKLRRSRFCVSVFSVPRAAPGP